ncbi:MAG: hypothetical protein SO006_06830 [Muribaculaceae bacterium]|nr:hypothetical protein [Muribaculaceae bacterium]
MKSLVLLLESVIFYFQINRINLYREEDMLKKTYSKYNRNGYSDKEAEHLMILEYRGIGYYGYRKEIEYILQVVKQSFESGNTTGKFDINSIPGCNIPYADSVIIKIDDDFSTGTYGVRINNA